MTDLVRTVRSGSVGLDLVLGGGMRLLRRVEGSSSESATMLVRGGPGTGKSALASDTALRLARALAGDVLYVCIEVLPSEVIAQRMGFDGFDPAKVIDLARPDARKTNGDGPTLIVGMTEMEGSVDTGGNVPDLGRMIFDLVRISAERGYDPRVVVVDSLSDGYQLGTGVARPIVDGVCKLAVEQGWVLLLVEEAVDERPSPWSFAVDTVLSLEVTSTGRREVRVVKHRFGPCQPGPHRLLIQREGIRVVPTFAAYRNALSDLAFPAPAKYRSLRLSISGGNTAVVEAQLDLPEGEGRLVAVETVGLAPGTAETFTAAMGRTAWNGVPQSAPSATLWLKEAHGRPFDSTTGELSIGTLHQMTDGEEWLESAFSFLNDIKSPLARIRVGPTERLILYEQRDTLQKAISLFSTLAARRGLLVIVYGTDPPEKVFRAGAIDELWSVTQAQNAPPGIVHVKRSTAPDTHGEFDVVG